VSDAITNNATTSLYPHTLLLSSDICSPNPHTPKATKIFDIIFLFLSRQEGFYWDTQLEEREKINELDGHEYTTT